MACTDMSCNVCRRCMRPDDPALPETRKRNMTAQRHTVATDALATIGHLITEHESRDAIHLAVEPALAATKLFPGQDVGRLEDGSYGPAAARHTGIVDPFLQAPVQPGEWFWHVVYPRQITSLRHVWEHPDFPPSVSTLTVETEREVFVEKKVFIEKTPVNGWIDGRHWTREESEAEARRLVDSTDGISYNEWIQLLTDGRASSSGDDDDYRGATFDGEYVHVSGRDASGEIPDELFDHFENILGKSIESRPEYFTCGC